MYGRRFDEAKRLSGGRAGERAGALVVAVGSNLAPNMSYKNDQKLKTGNWHTNKSKWCLLSIKNHTQSYSHILFGDFAGDARASKMDSRTTHKRSAPCNSVHMLYKVRC